MHASPGPFHAHRPAEAHRAVPAPNIGQRVHRAHPAAPAGVARVSFAWDATLTKCRATAFDALDRRLGELVVELTEDLRRRIWAARGSQVQMRLEDVAERHLRALLELRA
jgi:hypothetical protein